MALTITKLKMWRDPGYTRGCLEVPPVGSRKLPAADYENTEPLRPRKGSTLTSLELPLCYSEVFEMSYLWMQAEDPSGIIELFGWIDTCALIATSADAVRIDWSVDWWRSFSGGAVFGAGRLMRCADADRRRPISTQPRYRTVLKYRDIDDDESKGYLWVIVSYRETSGERNILTYPIFPDRTAQCHIGVAADINTTDPSTVTGGYCPSFIQTISGSIPTLLSLNSTSIDGAWISPICPIERREINPYPNVGYDFIISSAKYSFVNGAIKLKAASSTAQAGAPYIVKNLDIPRADGDDYSQPVMTTDTRTYVVTDCYGNIRGTVPYGIPFRYAIGVLDIGNVSCSLKIVFLNAPYDPIGYPLGKATTQGMSITISLPSVPISSSAYSDYVYSGQRDYEMELASLQNEQNMVHGLSGAIGGAAIGGLVGSIIPGAGTAVGALGGAAAGGITGAASAGINYAVDEFIYKDKFQDLEDKKYSNQSGNLMIPGDGFGWLKFYICPQIILLEADSTFQMEFIQHVAQEGYPCDSPVESVSPFITAGGPLQIRNLMITGDIPPVAKRTIKALLETGIRIQENNPTGTDPAITGE